MYIHTFEFSSEEDQKTLERELRAWTEFQHQEVTAQLELHRSEDHDEGERRGVGRTNYYTLTFTGHDFLQLATIALAFLSRVKMVDANSRFVRSFH